MLWPLLATLCSGLAFALIQILFRRYAGLDRGLLDLPSWLGLLFLVWGALFLSTWQTGLLVYNLAPPALLGPALWALCAATTTTGLVWLLQRLTLSEVTGYKKALLVLGSLCVDWVWFGVVPHWTLLVAVGLLLVGALGLGIAKLRMPRGSEWVVIVVWCGVLTLQVSLYKFGQVFQASVLAYAVIAQTMVSGLYALLWLLPTVRAQPPAPLHVALPLLACAMLGTLLEGYGYAGLPLSVVMLALLIPAALLGAYDLRSGGLPYTRRVGVCLMMIVAGFLLLIYK